MPMRLADLAIAELPIAGEVRIGREPPLLPEGACLRIVTGRAIPAGADAVIKREDVVEYGDRVALPHEVRIQSGQNIRRAGENLSQLLRLRSAGRRYACDQGSIATPLALRRPVFRRVRLFDSHNGG